MCRRAKRQLSSKKHYEINVFHPPSHMLQAYILAFITRLAIPSVFGTQIIFLYDAFLIIKFFSWEI